MKRNYNVILKTLFQLAYKLRFNNVILHT